MNLYVVMRIKDNQDNIFLITKRNILEIIKIFISVIAMIFLKIASKYREFQYIFKCWNFI